MLLSALDALVGRPQDDFEYLVNETLDNLNPGDRVKDALTKDATGTVYRYIGSAITTGVNLAQQHFNDATKWLEVVDPYGNEDPAHVSATVLDSTLDAAGNVTVTALNEAMINSTMSNAASSEASALVYATGMGFGGILASNKVSSDAEAFIGQSFDYTAEGSVALKPGDRVKVSSGEIFVYSGVSATRHLAAQDYVNSEDWSLLEKIAITAGGSVTVAANDNAGIYANTKLVSSSVTSNDGGLGIASDTLDTELNLLYPPNYVSDEGSFRLKFGDRVRLADNYGADNFSSGDGTVSVATGKYVLVDDGYADPTFTSDSGTRLLRTGDVVEVALGYDESRGEGGTLYRFVGAGSRGLRINLGIEDYTDTSRWKRIGGNAGSVYQYLGTTGTLNLGVQDYSNAGLWREVPGAAGDIYIYMGADMGPTDSPLNLATTNYSDAGPWKVDPTTQIIPSGINFTNSDSISIGGLFVLNDVRSDVEAYLSNAHVDSDGTVTVRALESAVMRAETDATSHSSGGSSINGAGDSIAGNAIVATNLVLSSSSAYIEASNITTSTAGPDGQGDIVVEAQNISQIDAITKSAANSEGNSGSFQLAFNTVGYRPQSLIFNTLDALLGIDLFGSEVPATVEAKILNSTVDAAGMVSVTADSAAQVYAMVTNEATSYATAIFGTTGMSVSGILSSNMVSSSADAFINGGSVIAGSGITVRAQDDAAIDAQTKMLAVVEPNNDGASGLVNNYVGLALDGYDYTSKSGIQDLDFGDKVFVVDDYYETDYFETNGDDQLVTLTPTTYDAGTIVPGTIVTLSDDYAGSGGLAGSSYMFIGPDPGGQVNIGVENFLDPSHWVEVGGTYQFMGTAALGKGVNLGTQDYTDFGLWKHLNPSNLITDSTVYAALEVIGTIMKKEGLTGSSQSFYGLIDRNDVRSAVNAYLLNTDVDASGDVTVEALESARIRALENSTISPWEGTGGVIATNNVLSSANAYVEGSSVTTTNGGDLNVNGMNISLIDADTGSTIEAWEGKSAVVAFNAVGWPAQNVFFNAIDAILGDPTMASIFGGEQPAQTQAYIVDSAINVDGDLSVTAINEAQINATVGNVNISEAALDIVIPGLMDGASAVAGGGILASNKVSSMAKAYIDYTGERGTVTADGAVTVHAEDNAGITSDSIAVQKAIASNTLAGVVDQVSSVLDILLPGDYDYTTKSGIITLTPVPSVLPDQFSPQQIRIASNYDASKGLIEANYRFIGDDLAILDTDLDTENGLQPLVDLDPDMDGIQSTSARRITPTPIFGRSWRAATIWQTSIPTSATSPIPMPKRWA